MSLNSLSRKLTESGSFCIIRRYGCMNSKSIIIVNFAAENYIDEN